MRGKGVSHLHTDATSLKAQGLVTLTATETSDFFSLTLLRIDRDNDRSIRVALCPSKDLNGTVNEARSSVDHARTLSLVYISVKSRRRLNQSCSRGLLWILTNIYII